jgi:hypothetical protein
MARPGPVAQPAWPAHANSATRAHPRGGHRAWGALDGAVGGSSPAAWSRRGMHLEHWHRAARRPGKVVRTGMHRGDGSLTRWQNPFQAAMFGGGGRPAADSGGRGVIC